MGSDLTASGVDDYWLIADWLKTSSEIGLFTPPELEIAMQRWCASSLQRFTEVVSPGFLKLKAGQELPLVNGFYRLDELSVEDYATLRIQIDVDYGIYKTCFGNCLMAVDQQERVCWLSFFEQGCEEAALNELKAFWYQSDVKFNQLRVEDLFRLVFHGEIAPEGHSFRLLAMGSPFHLRVWKQLLTLPRGFVISYHGLAKLLQLPGGSQAVGSALAKNHLALVVPCHRVIRKDGTLHEFRWGSVRKKMMIGFELLQRTTSQV
jgi:AraC family transcriptional regulator of adaptative response/methylated-DNA-[protein]-cysteine methyltransferase